MTQDNLLDPPAVISASPEFVKVVRYFVHLTYKTYDSISQDYDHHEKSEIVEMPENFTLQQVKQLLQVDDKFKHKVSIKCISRL